MDTQDLDPGALMGAQARNFLAKPPLAFPFLVPPCLLWQ